MKILKRLLIGLGSLVVLLLLIAFFLPSEYASERSIVINADRQAVFDLVNDLPSNEKWSPWAAKDPTLKVTYTETKAGVGAKYTWTSEEMGNGSLKIVESIAPERITNELDFGQGGLANGHWRFEKSGDGTKVTWGISGDAGMDPIGRWFNVFMDGLVGPDFEDGLARLKSVAEGKKV